MWKQTVGDWQERRHRRGAPVPTTPQTNLPESVVSNEHSARGFLPRGFHDRVPHSAYPAPDGGSSRLSYPDSAPPRHEAATRALTETWVTVTGALPDDVLDVRDFLDNNVGRTVSHYLPPPTRVRSDAVYIQFASSLQAAQAVRATTYTTSVESGVAAMGIKSTVGATEARDRPHYYLEIVVSWCTDQIFLEEREKLRRQLLESAAPSPLQQQQQSASIRSSRTSHSTERDAESITSLSLQSSARGSDPLATSGAANATHEDDDDYDNAAAHPLLPRHHSGPQQSPSPWSSRPRTSPPLTTIGSAAPSVRDPAAYYRSGGAYRYEDSFFSDGLHSSKRDGHQRTTVLSLFLHPCSASYGIFYSFFLYYPLRCALILLWTLGNAVGQLVPTSAAAGAAAADTQNGQRRAAPPMLPPLSRWRQRRALCMSDVVPASASPFDCLAFLFYKYVPFTPDWEEVDVVMWSWLALRSPQPQRSLKLLKQSLLLRQRSTDLTVGQLRPGRGSNKDGITDVNQLANFAKVDILGEEPYTKWDQQQQLERNSELPVLLRWRPAWWFFRYSSLSLVVLVVLVSCQCWYWIGYD